MTAPKRKRLQVHVVWNGRAWETRVNGTARTFNMLQQEGATRTARYLCRKLERLSFNVELYVHRRRGSGWRIRETYGADPRRSRG